MSAIRLYTQPFNPFSEKVARALHIKALDYDRVETSDVDEIKRLNPVTQLLPVLEIDGRRVHDSPVILRRLDDLHPEPPLLSRDPKVAAGQERLAEWSDTSFSWYWDRWRAARYPRPGDEQPVSENLLDRLKNAIDQTFGRPASTLTRVDVREAEVVAELVHRLDDLVGFLGDRPFFLSDTPSVADLSVFGMIVLLRDSPLPIPKGAFAERPSLVDYIARMEKATRRR